MIKFSIGRKAGGVNFSGRRARDVIHRYCMTSIISVLDLRTSSRTIVCTFFFFFLSVMPYYILVDPQIEYGARNRSLARQACYETWRKRVMWRDRRYSLRRVVLSIFYLNVRDQRGFCKRRRVPSRTERLRSYFSLRRLPVRIVSRTERGRPRQKRHTYYLQRDCAPLPIGKMTPANRHDSITVWSACIPRVILHRSRIDAWVARVITETVLFSLRLL